jgi:transcriptional regulator with XRE-family HTH domain
MTLGEKIKMLREKRGWTQTQAAEKIGISSQVLSNYERDYRSPDKEVISKIATLYNHSTDWLLGLTETESYQNTEIIRESSNGGRAYYGGGENWTEEEKQAADAFIEMLRARKKASEEKK